MATRTRRGAAQGSQRPDALGFSKLVLENVRCFARAEVPLDAQVTVIIGQNGAGKTTIAEALALLAHGEGEGYDDFPLRMGASSGSMSLSGAGGDVRARWAGAERKRLGPGMVFAYGQCRAMRPPPPRRGDPGLLGAASRLAELRPLPDNLSDIAVRSEIGTMFRFDDLLFRDLGAFAALLHDQGVANPAVGAAWQRFSAWLANLDMRIDGVTIADYEGRPRAVFQRSGMTLSISGLSDGYRAMLAVVLDLVIRYTAGFLGQDQPLDGEAMVVIDEVDLYLHPRWQRQVIRQLTALFPKTRFVLTTHSAAVVQAAIDERHRVLVLEEPDDEGTRVVPLKPGELSRLDGAEVDSVLVEVFGAPSRYSPRYEDVEKEAASLGEKVDRGEATVGDRKRLLGLLDELQGLLAKDDEMTRTAPLMSEIARTQIALLRRLDGEVTKRGQR